jgi:hypothetical protein
MRYSGHPKVHEDAEVRDADCAQGNCVEREQMQMYAILTLTIDNLPNKC